MRITARISSFAIALTIAMVVVSPASAHTTGSGHAEAASTKLSAAKLRACQNRQQAITNIMIHIADRGQKQLDLFTTIADRTEAFYAKRGKALSNYNELVADVNTKKAAATDTVNAIKSASATFDCDSDNPKGTVGSFKAALKTEIQALKNYRTAVKNLITGVKSVQNAGNSQ